MNSRDPRPRVIRIKRGSHGEGQGRRTSGGSKECDQGATWMVPQAAPGAPW